MFAEEGNSEVSINLKSSIDKLENLEAEKQSLLSEVENLKKIVDAKANTLANEIATLREEINALKTIVDPPQPSVEYLKERNLVYALELIEKTVNASNQLGNQVFPNMPFAQYFDSWLANLNQIATNFESDSHIEVDEQFAKDRSKIFLDIERVLTQKKAEESKIDAVSKALADNNHLMVEADREYAEKAKELSFKRDTEVHRLSNRVHELEQEIQSQEEDNAKRKPLKKKTDDKVPQTRLDLEAAKNELENSEKNFIAEQDKLNRSYEGKKQDVMGQVECLRKELEKLETDTSTAARQAACKAFADAVSALGQRTFSIA